MEAQQLEFEFNKEEKKQSPVIMLTMKRFSRPWSGDRLLFEKFRSLQGLPNQVLRK